MSSVNKATTIWAPNNGTSEFSVGSSNFLVDPTSATTFIVDPVAQASFEVDTGVTLTDEPATIWSQDDSL